MHSHIARRDFFIRSAALTTAAAGGSATTLAQTTPNAGSTPMTYEIKPLPFDPKRLRLGLANLVAARQTPRQSMGDGSHDDACGRATNLMFEHSYHLDYGARSAAYVDAFMDVIRWDHTTQLYERYSREA